MSNKFTKAEADAILAGLRNKTITPQHMTKSGELLAARPLEVIVSSEHTVPTIVKMAREAIKLGCSPDDYVHRFSHTPLIAEIDNIVYGEHNTKVLELLMKHHTKGHDSDYFILKHSSATMRTFEVVINSGRIDVEASKFNRNILYDLAKDETSAEIIDFLFEKVPNITPNTLDNKGNSPLAVAIKQKAVGNINNTQKVVEALLKNENTKIIGPLDNQMIKTIIDLEIIDRYNGDFLNDFPDAIGIIASMGKTHLLPENVVEMFIF